MLLDIFSSLDYFFSNLQCFNWVVVVWLIPVVLFLVKLVGFYVRQGIGFLVRVFYRNGWISELKSKRFFFFFCIFFFVYVCFENLLGLFPYTFRITRHIVLKFYLAFEFWLVIVIYGVYQNFYGFISHFTPMGRPIGLAFPLKYIEWIRLLIRPLTLSLRLAVNIRTGHIFIGLLRTGFIMSGGLGLVVIFVCFFGYILFEIFVSFIQGFVFRLLLVQYADEV